MSEKPHLLLVDDERSIRDFDESGVRLNRLPQIRDDEPLTDVFLQVDTGKPGF